MPLSMSTEILCRQPKRKTIREKTISALFSIQDNPRWGRMITAIDVDRKPVNAPVQMVYQHRKSSLLCCRLKNGLSINATPDQLLLTAGGYKPLASIKTGESVACIKTKQLWWSAVTEVVPLPGLFPVYSIKLEEYSAYIANRIVVAQ